MEYFTNARPEATVRFACFWNRKSIVPHYYEDFLGIAFYGTMAFKDLVETALTIYVAKVLYEIVALPVSMRLAQYLKQVEHVDQIDNPGPTNYSPFNLH